jgi:putative sigma-54 modulation protein
MQINLSGHHVDISPALKDYVYTKLQRLARHSGHVTNAYVVLSIEKMRQKAEATIHVSRAHLFADAIDEDMYAAIDALTDKLDRQLKRHKDKLTDHRQNAVARGRSSP